MREKLSDIQVKAWARLVWASQATVEAIENDLKVAGLPPLDWYDILLELERSERGELRPKELAAETLFTRYNVTRLVNRMEAEGLVTRGAHPDDGRGAVVRITRQGRAMRKKIWPVYEEAIEKHFASKLSDEEAQTLANLLATLIRGTPGAD